MTTKWDGTARQRSYNDNGHDRSAFYFSAGPQELSPEHSITYLLIFPLTRATYPGAAFLAGLAAIFDDIFCLHLVFMEVMIMTQLNAKQTEFANALYQAYAKNEPLTESDWTGVVTDDDTAYAVQDQVMQLKGQPVAGYKVSLTSKQTQDMFDADSPLYGQQVAERFLTAPADVNLADLNEPLVEVELAFRAKEDLHSNDSLDDLLHKVTVAGALEVPDARFKDWFPSLGKYNVMSDCAVGGLVVLGTEKDADLVFSDVAAAATVNATLVKDGKELASGTSAEVLGNPLESLKWLVTKLEAQGKGFKAGQVVSSGTFVLPPHLTAGKWEVHFDHELGDVVVNAK